MALRLHDTLSRTVKELKASDGQSLRMYCCGPTVYGPAHIGNFRTFILQDVLVRTAEVAGLNPTFVRNLTDVDDKTIRQSQAEGKPLEEFTGYWTDKFHADAAALNLTEPHKEPAATDHIPAMVTMIEQLLEKDHAYVGGDGSVYFRVNSFPEYGKLSHLDREQLRTQETQSGGEANLADEYERDSVADFALWKAHKAADGDNAWEGPRGIRGRPGWHIECSAMSAEYLITGDLPIDLHSGGVDLCFPHHENEIAQYEAATGRPFVLHWFHCAHLLVDGAKMSKSLGNLYTLDDLKAKGVSPVTLRYVLLSAHYRQQLNFTMNSLNAAQSALEKLAKAVDSLATSAGLDREQAQRWYGKRPYAEDFDVLREAWDELCDDLNTPGALGKLFGALKELQTDNAALAAQNLSRLLTLLYALGIDPFSVGSDVPDTEAPEAVEALAQQRWDAKQARDFARADALRDEIASQGWTVKDRKDGYDLIPS